MGTGPILAKPGPSHNRAGLHTSHAWPGIGRRVAHGHNACTGARRVAPDTEGDSA